jgi:hypothetical protein
MLAFCSAYTSTLRKELTCSPKPRFTLKRLREVISDIWQAQKFLSLLFLLVHMERFNLKKLNEVEGKEQ